MTNTTNIVLASGFPASEKCFPIAPATERMSVSVLRWLYPRCVENGRGYVISSGGQALFPMKASSDEWSYLIQQGVTQRFRLSWACEKRKSEFEWMAQMAMPLSMEGFIIVISDKDVTRSDFVNGGWVERADGFLFENAVFEDAVAPGFVIRFRRVLQFDKNTCQDTTNPQP